MQGVLGFYQKGGGNFVSFETYHLAKLAKNTG